MGDAETKLVESARAEAVTAKTEAKDAKAKAKTARTHADKALSDAGFAEEPPEIADYVNAKMQHDNHPTARNEGRLGIAEIDSAQAREKLGAEGVEAQVTAGHAELAAEDATSTYQHAANTVRAAPARQKALSDLRAAVAEGDSRKAVIAHEKLQTLYEGHEDSSPEIKAFLDSDPTELIDGDGDGRTGTAEEGDDEGED